VDFSTRKLSLTNSASVDTADFVRKLLVQIFIFLYGREDVVITARCSTVRDYAVVCCPSVRLSICLSVTLII